MIYILIIIGIVWYIVKGKGLTAARVRNWIITWATGSEGYCFDCKHCREDKSRRFSKTDYYCSLFKCEDITSETYRNCFEKPKITEEDLTELFELGIWNDKGKTYLRNTLLGKAMTFSELDEFLTKLPNEHPEYIDSNFDVNNIS